MIVSLIVAMDEKGGIGKDNSLPWRLSSDLKRFRELTVGHHIIMGRKTFESIGKALQGRQTIIVTRKRSYAAEGCLVVNSLKSGLALARDRQESEVFICGGAEIYAQAIGLADRLYLTLVHAEVDADVFFPDWEKAAWVEEESLYHAANEKNQYPSTFKRLVKKRAL